MIAKAHQQTRTIHPLISASRRRHFQRYWTTIRYLAPRQLWYRGRRIARQQWWKRSAATAPCPTDWQMATFTPLYCDLKMFTAIPQNDRMVAQTVQEAQAIAQGRFSFLKHEVDFNHTLSWHDQQLSQLWRYHLHYFNYVTPLLVWSVYGNADKALGTFKALVTSWIEHNQSLTGDGWHPYTLSLRLVNWLYGVVGFQTEKQDITFHQQLVTSLYGQAQLLYSDLELDVRGNHLLKNLRALIWVGTAFYGSEPKRWLARGLELLEVEIAEQILGDGGHFERTPSYHLVVLKDLFEIALFLRRNQASVPQWLDDALERMLTHLITTLPPDGNVALLKDTAWDAAPCPSELLAVGALYFNRPQYKYSDHFGLYPYLLWGREGQTQYKAWAITHRRQPSTYLSLSGYAVLRNDAQDDYLILDVGKPCPDYLPAHAHADLLSYELTVAGERVVVDSGVYEYAAGSWRDYFRSTAAHNTVAVAGQNQSDVWGGFRVANRAKPTVRHWAATNDYVVAQAYHDGYKMLATRVIHRRTLCYWPDRLWFFVDELWGNGTTNATSYIHLHPKLRWHLTGKTCWQIDGTISPLWVSTFGVDTIDCIYGQVSPVYQGWYAEEFGERQANHVLALHTETTMPVCFGYAISKATDVTINFSTLTDRVDFELIHGSQNYLMQLTKKGPPHIL